jgi:DNA N-6-adenine-methyltransferase (Dam)
MTMHRRPINRVLFSSQSVEWATPMALHNALDAEFHFDLDPCPLGSLKDGLKAQWKGHRVFCNPPYGNILPWLRRGREADLAVFLVPARTDTLWFHDLVLPYACEIRFIRGRLKFGDAKNSAPFPSMVVVMKQGDPRDQRPRSRLDQFPDRRFDPPAGGGSAFDLGAGELHAGEVLEVLGGGIEGISSIGDVAKPGEGALDFGDCFRSCVLGERAGGEDKLAGPEADGVADDAAYVGPRLLDCFIYAPREGEGGGEALDVAVEEREVTELGVGAADEDKLIDDVLGERLGRDVAGEPLGVEGAFGEGEQFGAVFERAGGAGGDLGGADAEEVLLEVEPAGNAFALGEVDDGA